MTRLITDRRKFLLRGAALGCSAAASPFLTPVSFAAAPWDARLIVIILRGGMDGLDVVRPYGDRAFAGLRPGLGRGAAGGLDLDGFYALHPGLSELMPLWHAGELAFAHAVSTPYRDKRSHFDGQDLLEAGTGFGPAEPAARDGWLNRMLQTIPGVTAQTAYAIGREDLLLLSGAAEVANWSPHTRLSLSPQVQRLLEVIYDDDPLFRASILEALDLTAAIEADMEEDPDLDGDAPQSMEMAPKRNDGHLKLAGFAAQRLRDESRIAAFSLNGWDTHRGQEKSLGKALVDLSETILELRRGLGGEIWAKTSVVAMTEFGRTARENGTQGTDHGTGGAMVMAGGAVRGGKVYGRWPGLEEAQLYGRRDLMPTEDVRGYAAVIMRDLLGIAPSALEGSIFPGLDIGAVPRMIL